MNSIYNIGIYFYKLAIFIVSFFNDKARKLYNGQRDTFEMLEEEIEPHSQYVWFHAASLGEFEQGRPVMERLKSEHPETRIILTFFSPSGYEVRKNYEGANIIAYLPLDTKRAARKFVKLVHPSKAIFIKYEFWPNYLLALQASKVPVFSISSIFRPNQIFFKWYGSWYLNILKTLHHIFVQDDISLQLLNKNGISDASVAGDTRFDRVYDLYQKSKQLMLIEEFCVGQQVLVAGSTWAKDEELLVQYLILHPNIKLILVPHEIHHAHITEISKLLDGKFVRYSDANSDNLKNTNCLVVDVIGILSSIYRYANVAYIGGGFGVGIHNTLEAAVYGVPVIFGPNYHKFREARDLIAIGGAFSISNYIILEAQIDRLLKDKTAGKIAGEYVKNNTGATDLIIKGLNI
jgi:3-deoxy-D-manno-octulosonic-acid transferase